MHETCADGNAVCSVLQCVAVCCSVLQCVAVCCATTHTTGVCCVVELLCGATQNCVFVVLYNLYV